MLRKINVQHQIFFYHSIICSILEQEPCRSSGDVEQSHTGEHWGEKGGAGRTASSPLQAGAKGTLQGGSGAGFSRYLLWRKDALCSLVFPTADHAGTNSLHLFLVSRDQPRLLQTALNFCSEYSALSWWLEKAAAGNGGRMWHTHQESLFKIKKILILQSVLPPNVFCSELREPEPKSWHLSECDLHKGKNPTAFTPPLWVIFWYPSSWAFTHVWPWTRRNYKQRRKSRERRAAFEINPTVQIPLLSGKYYDPVFASCYTHWREGSVGCVYVCQGSIFSSVFI